MKVLKLQYLFLPLIVLSLSACVNSKKVKIFTGLQHDSSSLIINNRTDNTIKPGDILQITVFCLDEETRKVLNNISASAGDAGSGNGYLVDDSGYIKFPLLGRIHCVNMVKNQLADSLKNILLARKFVLDPIVTVRISNFKITILGEVNRPGVLEIPNENVNIIEAIGLAGDLTLYAKRDNVLLIRETKGKRIYKRFSLNDPKLFSKEYFILQNQDVIYIEPFKAKAATLDRSSQFISLGLTSLSVFLLIYSQLVK